jgi:CheY-like chemotaxis protein
MSTILLIEDNQASKLLVERVLENVGYKILCAADGESGIAKAIKNEPDLILIDMGLPDIDGQTVVTVLQQVPSLRNTPMVAITALAADKARETVERYRLDGCILKPIEVSKFPEQIAGYLKIQA